MSSNTQFSVYSSGDVEPDKDIDSVKREFAELFGISEEKADKYFQTKKLIRKGLTADEASAYQINLQKIGMLSVVEEAISQAAASNEPVNNATIKEPSNGSLSLLPADYEASDPQGVQSAVQKSNISCPKCHVEQTKSKQCESCGIFFEKLVDSPRTKRTTPTSDTTMETHYYSNGL